MTCGIDLTLFIYRQFLKASVLVDVCSNDITIQINNWAHTVSYVNMEGKT